jgi:hypothetical protein
MAQQREEIGVLWNLLSAIFPDWPRSTVDAAGDSGDDEGDEQADQGGSQWVFPESLIQLRSR